MYRTSSRIPLALEYHIIDSFVQELRNSKVKLQLLFLEPFFKLYSNTLHGITLDKLQDSLWTPLVLQEDPQDPEEEDEQEKEKVEISFELKSTILTRLLECAQENTLESKTKTEFIKKLQLSLESLANSIELIQEKEKVASPVKKKKRVSFGENQIKKFNKKVAISLPFSEGLPSSTRPKPKKSIIKK